LWSLPSYVLSPSITQPRAAMPQALNSAAHLSSEPHSPAIISERPPEGLEPFPPRFPKYSSWRMTPLRAKLSSILRLLRSLKVWLALVMSTVLSLSSISFSLVTYPAYRMSLCWAIWFSEMPSSLRSNFLG